MLRPFVFIELLMLRTLILVLDKSLLLDIVKEFAVIELRTFYRSINA